jgi:hypothetical protein
VLDFIVAKNDLARTLELVRADSRNLAGLTHVWFTTRADSLEVRTPATVAEIPAECFEAGTARVPIHLADVVRGVARTFRRRRLHIKLSVGRFQIESFGRRDNGIALE